MRKEVHFLDEILEKEREREEEKEEIEKECSVIYHENCGK